MKRKIKIIVVSLSLPLWLLALGLLLEVLLTLYADHRAERNVWRINEIADAHRAADDIVFQEIKATVTPPDTVPWRAPARDTILKSGEAERFGLARERKELILSCDVDGIIAHIYPCNSCRELDTLGNRLSPGDSLEAILPPAELADALDSIRQTGEEEKPMRDYTIPLGDGTTHLVEFNVLRLSKEPFTFTLFLADSRFEAFLRRYRPNVYRRNWYAAQFRESEFWTNSLGFRNEEITIPKPDGVFRIVCIGGSTTVEGPHNNLTYPKVLERLLRSHFHTSRIEAVNCGVDGMAFPGEQERMEDWLALQPDMILHYNIINNTSWLIQSATEKALEEDGFTGHIYQAASESKLFSGMGLSCVYPDTAFFTAELDRSVFSCFREMQRSAQEAGALMAIASFAVPDGTSVIPAERDFFESTFHMTPTKGGRLNQLNRMIDEYNRCVHEFCSENNLLYIPVAENLTGGIETFTDICHLRIAGIRKKAAIIYEHIRDVVGEGLELTDNPLK
ncbi:MAG TPA: hypothetical protein PLL36_00050 [Candidatus Hydrogenedentes bacterium]|nr:hypothetical protein [Candidatus Hydrogenedentota bacterium]HQM99431.1 hypothetical protein [Candidatus Hydrogenedentota bacterium]